MYKYLKKALLEKSVSNWTENPFLSGSFPLSVQSSSLWEETSQWPWPCLGWILPNQLLGLF